MEFTIKVFEANKIGFFVGFKEEPSRSLSISRETGCILITRTTPGHGEITTAAGPEQFHSFGFLSEKPDHFRCDLFLKTSSGRLHKTLLGSAPIALLPEGVAWVIEVSEHLQFKGDLVRNGQDVTQSREKIERSPSKSQLDGLETLYKNEVLQKMVAQPRARSASTDSYLEDLLTPPEALRGLGTRSWHKLTEVMNLVSGQLATTETSAHFLADLDPTTATRIFADRHGQKAKFPSSRNLYQWKYADMLLRGGIAGNYFQQNPAATRPAATSPLNRQRSHEALPC